MSTALRASSAGSRPSVGNNAGGISPSASGDRTQGERFAEHNMGLPYGWNRDTAGGTTPDSTGCQVGQDDANAPQQLFGQPGG